MTQYPVDSIKQPAQPDSNTPLDALRKARDGICSNYRNIPNWFTGGALIHPVTRDVVSAMDNLCSDKPKPPPTTRPFNGGQCEGVLYDVTFIQLNPSTGNTSSFVSRVPGKLGGLFTRSIGVDSFGVAAQNWRFTYGISAANPKGSELDLSNGRVDRFRVSVASIVRVGGQPDNCGNPPNRDPVADDPGNSITVNVDLPDIRFEPNVNVVVPVVIFRPEFNITNNFTAEFNIPINIGGQRFNFDGSSITLNKNVNVDFSQVNSNITSVQNNLNTSISNSQTNINNNTNTRISNSQTSINNNTNTQLTTTTNNINSNTNTQLTTTTNNINSNTNTQLTTVTNNINSNTNTQLTTTTNNINNSINTLRVDLSGQLNAIALVVGTISADLGLALSLLAEINLKPDCPEFPLAPGTPDVDDVVKPEEPKNGNNPRIQAVTIVLTQLPNKRQWGGGSGAPDKEIAGWFAWKVEGYGYLAQQNINYQQSTYIRPPNVSGYAYTLTNSAKGFAIEHTLRN